MPRPVTEGDREPGGGQGPVADGRRVQDGPRAKAGSMAPRLSTETRISADGQGLGDSSELVAWTSASTPTAAECANLISTRVLRN